MKIFLKKMFGYKIIRYSIGGGLAALIDLFFLWLFTDIFGLYYLFSAIGAFIISLTFGYLFQKYITFRNYSKRHILQGGLFLLFQLIGQGIYMFILWIGVDHLYMYYLLVAVIAKLIVFVRNYIANYYFNFKK